MIKFNGIDLFEGEKLKIFLAPIQSATSFALVTGQQSPIILNFFSNEVNAYLILAIQTSNKLQGSPSKCS